MIRHAVMQGQQSSGWPMRRLHVAAVVAFVALAGCGRPPEAPPPRAFCGLLYTCGSDSDTNQGGNQTATGSSSGDSTSSSTNTGETTGD